MDQPAGAAQGRTRAWRRLLPMACAVAILALLVHQVGAPAFVDGLARVDVGSVVMALALTAAATLACAWRWRLVAGALGFEVPLRAAVPAYYRSQFLNSTVPGGVAGDVHRGVRHGSGELGAGLRAVGWERTAGQVVQLVLAVGILVVVPSQLAPALPLLCGAAVVLGILAVLLTRLGPRTSRRRLLDVAAHDLRALTTDARVWPGVVVASVVVVAAHVATFVVAVRAAGVTVQPTTMVQLAVVVLLAMAVPLNVAGFGPREGVAAWGFAAVGAGASAGITVAVVYGVLAIIATAPGLIVLLVSRRPTPVAGHG